MGVIHILKYRNKNIWWISKCIWNIVHSVIVYLGIFLGLWIFSCIMGNPSWKITSGLSNNMRYSLLTEDSRIIFLYIFFLGTITMAAINQMQITLQMIVDPVVAYIIYLGNLVFSVFLYTKYLPGNNLMLYRTKLFQENGVDMKFEILYLCGLWIAAVVIGMRYIKKSDIL